MNGPDDAERLVLTVLLTLRPGGEARFEAYERKAFAIAAGHGGRLDLRVVRAPGASGPDEIHLVSFPDAEAFERYRADPRLSALAEERTGAIAETTVLMGRRAEDFTSHES